MWKSSEQLGLALWSFPAFLFINDLLFTVSIVKDDGMAPTMRKGDFVLVDKRSPEMGGQPRMFNKVVLFRNPEAMRGDTHLRLIRKIGEQPLRNGKLSLIKTNTTLKEEEEARDSKDFGAVPEALVLGTVVAVLFPPWRMTWKI